MKDQNTIVEDESQLERWNLRSCAYNQKCYKELMEIRDTIIDLAYNMSYPDND